MFMYHPKRKQEHHALYHLVHTEQLMVYFNHSIYGTGIIDDEIYPKKKSGKES